MDPLLAAEIVDFDRSLLPRINALFRTHFAPDDRLLSDVYSNWLYRDNPFGRAKIVIVPGQAGYLALMALIPVLLARRDEQARAYFVVNVLVDPEQRGNNLFGRMIEAASAFVSEENAILMGHPNALALRGWQRAGMHFHDELKPVLASPVRRLRWTGAETATSLEAVERFTPGISDECSSGAGWKVALSGAYLEWRFLLHPTNRYTIQLLDFPDGRGVQVVKRINHGAHLLIDQFVSGANALKSFNALPIPTLCFLPERSRERLRGAAFPLPLKKRIPLFATRFSVPIESRDVDGLGLSATDL